MRIGRLVSTVLAAGFATFAFAAAAFANTTIIINPGNLTPPPTAQSFPTHMCDPAMGGGPFPTQDVWVFVLPDRNANGDFVSLDATFSTGTVHIDTTNNPGNFIIGGPQTSKAWVLAPAGATLTAASAVVTGTVDPTTTHFELTHTCPASGSPSPSPSMSTIVPSTSMSTPATKPVPSGGAETGGGGSYGVTGMGVGALLLACSGGLALIWLRNRKQSA